MLVFGAALLIFGIFALTTGIKDVAQGIAPFGFATGLIDVGSNWVQGKVAK